METIVVLIVSVTCGIIARYVSADRGMDGGFLWGFFLGIIVVAVRPKDRK